MRIFQRILEENTAENLQENLGLIARNKAPLGKISMQRSRKQEVSLLMTQNYRKTLENIDYN